jgi:predicted DNA-binding protein (UPF0278 family)
MSGPSQAELSASLDYLLGRIRRFNGKLEKFDVDAANVIRALIEHGPEVDADTIRGSLTISISEMKQARFPDDILDSLMADWRNKFVQALREAGVGVKEEK